MNPETPAKVRLIVASLGPCLTAEERQSILSVLYRVEELEAFRVAVGRVLVVGIGATLTTVRNQVKAVAKAYSECTSVRK